MINAESFLNIWKAHHFAMIFPYYNFPSLTFICFPLYLTHVQIQTIRGLKCVKLSFLCYFFAQSHLMSHLSFLYIYIFLFPALWVWEQHLHLPSSRPRDQRCHPHWSCIGNYWKGPEAHTWTGAQSKGGRYLSPSKYVVHIVLWAKFCRLAQGWFCP